MAMMRLLLLLFIGIGIQRVFCISCEQGSYAHNKQCQQCPKTCITCDSEAFCSGCQAGYYGESCSQQCHNCRNNCSKSSGLCIACEDGYFFNQQFLCVPCPEYCLVCSTENDCSSCKTGFKGNQCEEHCTNCKPETNCDKITGTCVECEDGLSGTNCQLKCHPKCSSCHRVQSDICFSCAQDRHGNNCEHVCPEHCLETACINSKGSCTHGCKTGYWGERCEQKCSLHCNGSVCDRDNGSCSHGCTGSFQGLSCLCPGKCSCHTNGTCLHCDLDPEIVCDARCSEGCMGQFCYRKTEVCIDDCKEGYKGIHCIKGIQDNKQQNEYNPVVWLSASAAVAVAVIILTVDIYIIYVKRKAHEQQTSNQDTPTALREDQAMNNVTFVEAAENEDGSPMDYLTPVGSSTMSDKPHEYMELQEELMDPALAGTYTEIGQID